VDELDKAIKLYPVHPDIVAGMALQVDPQIWSPAVPSAHQLEDVALRTHQSELASVLVQQAGDTFRGCIVPDVLGSFQVNMAAQFFCILSGPTLEVCPLLGILLPCRLLLSMLKGFLKDFPLISTLFYDGLESLNLFAFEIHKRLGDNPEYTALAIARWQSGRSEQVDRFDVIPTYMNLDGLRKGCTADSQDQHRYQIHGNLTRLRHRHAEFAQFAQFSRKSLQRERRHVILAQRNR